VYFLTDPLINHIRYIFQNLEINGPETGDLFFATFGPGNMLYFTDKPFERFSDYEKLLMLLQQDDTQKYKQIHKGVPFYYLSWTSFDMGNYEKALFYMDAAISEDIRKDPGGWLNNPAGSFLTLGPPNIQAAMRVASLLRQLLESQLNRFNVISGRDPITAEDFVDKFVRILVVDPTKRSIITALYTFLLEFQDRCTDLTLRSDVGGSIEPFLTHLFKGGLIFESLLKHLYPNKDNGQPVKTLGDIFHTCQFRANFLTNVQTSSSSLQDIVKDIKATDLQTAFNTASRIRNTTGHNLVWIDIFDDSKTYQILFEQQMNAILYIVSVKFP